MKNLAVLISGRGSNFKAINEGIKSGYISNANISVVISSKKDVAGLNYAKDEGMNAFHLDSSDYRSKEIYDMEIKNILDKYRIDLICLAGYMKILTPQLVSAYRSRIINIHPSLLPSFPGLNAQKQAIDYGVKVTGCTVHFVDEKIDHGPIILQWPVNVRDDDTEISLSKRILESEHKLYPQAVKWFVEDRILIKKGKVHIRRS